jgi:hypothetical protein
MIDYILVSAKDGGPVGDSDSKVRPQATSYNIVLYLNSIGLASSLHGDYHWQNTVPDSCGHQYDNNRLHLWSIYSERQNGKEQWIWPM